MKLIKLQKFFVRYLFKTNQSNNIETIKSIFKTKFNFPINLTNTQITYEKNQTFGTINTLDSYELCQKIPNDDIKVNIKSLDVFLNMKKRRRKIDFYYI